MTTKQNILIKGTKDGLLFLINDDCSFDEVIEELKYKLENSHQAILTGPIMRVTVKTGTRRLTEYQEETIRDIFKLKGNLFLHTIMNEEDTTKENINDNVQVIKKTVRSGQVFQYEGNILLVGDVNPGGNLLATGDIYILGKLRGIAHAGYTGDIHAIIAASIMEPTQLRIANLVSRPPEETSLRKWSSQEVAYVQEDNIVIDQIQKFSKLRKAMGALI